VKSKYIVFANATTVYVIRFYLHAAFTQHCDIVNSNLHEESTIYSFLLLWTSYLCLCTCYSNAHLSFTVSGI